MSTLQIDSKGSEVKIGGVCVLLELLCCDLAAKFIQGLYKMQAEHLQTMKHCFTASPDTLLEVMQQYDPSELVPYAVGDATGIVEAIEGHMDAISARLAA